MIVRYPPDFPCPGRDPLLDDATAEIGVNLPLLGARHGLPQGRVRNLLLAGKPLKPLRFEYSRLAHARIPLSLNSIVPGTRFQGPFAPLAWTRSRRAARTGQARGHAEAERQVQGKASGANGSGEAEAEDNRGAFSAGLIEDLTAQKSAAISAALMENSRLALVTVVHAIAVRTILPHAGSETCLQVSAQREFFQKAEGSRAVQRIAEAGEQARIRRA